MGVGGVRYCPRGHIPCDDGCRRRRWRPENSRASGSLTAGAVDFLSAAQIAGYGRYGEPPSARQLERFDGLLELQQPGAGGPTMIITDQASYSDQVFGLYWLLATSSAHAPGCPTSASGSLTATPTTAR